MRGDGYGKSMAIGALIAGRPVGNQHISPQRNRLREQERAFRPTGLAKVILESSQLISGSMESS